MALAGGGSGGYGAAVESPATTRNTMLDRCLLWFAVAALSGCAAPVAAPDPAAAAHEGACVRLIGSNVCRSAAAATTSQVQVVPADALRRAGPEAIGAPPTPAPK
jgi:hypothetical protein